MPGIVYRNVAKILNDLGSNKKNILEIGCGSKQYRRFVTGSYCGLDLPTSKHIEELPEIVGSAEAIPADKETFDFVFAVGTMIWITEVDRALEECFRVLEPGGSLLIFDYQKHICEKLYRDRPDLNKHIWDGKELINRVIAAGFPTDKVKEIKEQFYFSLYAQDLLRFPLQWRGALKRIAGRSDWLVIIAQKK